MKIKEIQYISPDLFAPKDAWDKLSMAEKSEMMKVAVRNGIYNLSDIKQKYNEYAEGGDIYPSEEVNEFGGGGYIYDVLPGMLKKAGLDIRVSSGYRPAGKVGTSGKRSWHWRHGAVDIVPKGKTTFEDIERVVRTNPEIIRYMTENGFGYLDETNRTQAGKDLMKQTGATGNHFHFGRDTRARERYQSILKGLNTQGIPAPATPITPVATHQQYTTEFIPSNPQVFFAPLSSYYEPAPIDTSQPTQIVDDKFSKEALEAEQKREGWRTLNWILNMTAPEGEDNSILSTLNLFAGNTYKEGGGIHIKPSHRGRLTELKERTGKTEAELYNDGNPAHKKMVVFARNARKWKRGDGGNLFDDEDNLYPDGGVFSKIGQWIRDKKNYIEKRAEEAGVVYKRRIPGQLDNEKYILVPRRPNTSKTKIKSQDLENRMYNMIAGNKERTHYRTNPYDIPYGERTITVQPAGSTIPVTLSVNALDSIAKYAGIVERDPKNMPYIQDTNMFLKEAFGLPYQETRFGAIPYYNYGDLPKGYTDNNLGNANYFRNFGSIPAEHLIRDFRYNGDIVNKKTLERPAPIPLTTPPLKHGLEFYLEGMYNPGDKNHTNDVRRAGSSLWNETTGNFLNWWNTEGKYWKENPEGPKK